MLAAIERRQGLPFVTSTRQARNYDDELIRAFASPVVVEYGGVRKMGARRVNGASSSAKISRAIRWRR